MSYPLTWLPCPWGRGGHLCSSAPLLCACPQWTRRLQGMYCTPLAFAYALLLEVLSQGFALLKAVFNSRQLSGKQLEAARRLYRNAGEKMCRKEWNHLHTGGTQVHFPRLPNSQTWQRAPTGRSLPSVAKSDVKHVKTRKKQVVTVCSYLKAIWGENWELPLVSHLELTCCM